MADPSRRLVLSGIPDAKDVAAVIPSPERLARGPVAVVECFQRIPCDPCATACLQGAIVPFDDICDLPRIDHEACNGCGLCIVRCPGLAIFVVDLSRGETALVKLPYEFLPLPRAGEEVAGLDRGGHEVCRARVVRVQRPAGFDRTALVTVEVPAGQALAVRAVRAPERAPVEAGGDPLSVPAEGCGPVVICRCEEVTEAAIVAAFEAGYRSPDEIKRKLRCGMGPCQGRTCGPLILSLLSRLTGRPVEEIAPTRTRPPLRATPLGLFAALAGDAAEGEHPAVAGPDGGGRCRQAGGSGAPDRDAEAGSGEGGGR